MQQGSGRRAKISKNVESINAMRKFEAGTHKISNTATAQMEKRPRRQRRKQKKNRLWIHKINRKRPEFGIFHHLHPDLRKDERKFYSFFRMSEELFSILLDLVGQEISKQDTNYRKSITAEERLSICLRYLITGHSFTSLTFYYRVGLSTIHEIVKETTQALCNALQPRYMAVPSTDEWTKIAQDYNALAA
ncbi:DDE Tnp4 domain-containing protein [Trichonephila clavata]|uniref:DDE Tnp4 domain-containing protein n=1 Tax=Trichonephila clavata TaxID=2740835 RepID=A0A8X6IFD9_TRICU|nr:DDE Tnp4 domain-containing protein [Trichonephila clavata]